MYFHCVVPVAPVRSQPTHKSEMISQLLFGEAAEITETATGGWAKITGATDGYEGWVTRTHLTPIGNPQPAEGHFASEIINTVLVNKTPMLIPYGSLVPNDSLAFNTTKTTWDFSPAKTASPEEPNRENLVRIAHLYLNATYVWGGKSIYGLDCSGLVQQVYKWAGILLPRDAWQQAEKGEALDFLMETLPGDLAFFDNEEGRIIHVGILLNSYSILHVSGKVRIDPIDTEGIVNSETGSRTHHLRIIKRLL